MSKLITVFGATGNQGGSVIRAILADSTLSNEFKIRAITRDASKPEARALADQGIEVVVAEMSSPSSVATAVKGAHTVYLVTNFWESMSADPEILQGKLVTDACKEADVQHLIFSSLIDASKATGGRLVHITHFDGKAAVERYIRDSGLNATFVMPGIFMTELFSLIRKQEDGTFVLAAPNSPKSPAPFLDVRSDTGKFVKAAIKNAPSAGGTNTIYASSEYYTFEKIASDFEEVIGKPLTVIQIPEDVFKTHLSYVMPPNMAEEISENLVLLDEPGYYAGADLSESLSLLDESPVSVKQFIAQNKGKWA